MALLAMPQTTMQPQSDGVQQLLAMLKPQAVNATAPKVGQPDLSAAAPQAPGAQPAPAGQQGSDLDKIMKLFQPASLGMDPDAAAAAAPGAAAGGGGLSALFGLLGF